MYFGIRAFLALLCALCECVFIRGARARFGNGVANRVLLFLLLSPGMFIAASSTIRWSLLTAAFISSSISSFTHPSLIYHHPVITIRLIPITSASHIASILSFIAWALTPMQAFCHLRLPCTAFCLRTGAGSSANTHSQ